MASHIVLPSIKKCWEVPFNGWPRVWKLEAIGGMEPTLDGDYAKYLRDNVAQFSTNRIFGRFRLDSRAFQLLNVRFLVTRSPSTIDHPDWDLVYDSYFRIYEYRKFTPRFRVVGNEERIRHHRCTWLGKLAMSGSSRLLPRGMDIGSSCRNAGIRGGTRRSTGSPCRSSRPKRD